MQAFAQFKENVRNSYSAGFTNEESHKSVIASFANLERGKTEYYLFLTLRYEWLDIILFSPQYHITPSDVTHLRMRLNINENDERFTIKIQLKNFKILQCFFFFEFYFEQNKFVKKKSESKNLAELLAHRKVLLSLSDNIMARLYLFHIIFFLLERNIDMICKW